MITKTFTLNLPPSPHHTNPVTTNGTIVIVGANGSGKTRLGAFIENQYKEKAHRISAQKSLQMPEVSSTTSIDKARGKLLYGRDDGTIDHRDSSRWQRKPYTTLLNDYEALVQYLFTEDYLTARAYRTVARANADRVEAPPSKLETVKRIWEELLPQRELVFASNQIGVRLRGGGEATYLGSELSDGERVIFYLIGQALFAPVDGIIILDEPEIHLHQSLQSELWNRIEAERPDCLFVYLTHDLNFAASRANATKICLTSYDHVRWEWIEVPSDSEIPEEILLEILGSRKPVLFIEGERGSLDYFVYQRVYSDFTIVPVGSCENVIHITRSFDSMKSLHHLSSHGLLDRDFRENQEVDYLRGVGIEVLEFSELENLFLTENVIKALAQRLMKDGDEVFDSVKAVVLAEMKKSAELVASLIAIHQIETALKKFDATQRGESNLTDALVTLTNSIDVKGIYNKADAEVQNILATADYENALKRFCNKGLLSQVAPKFGCVSKGFIEYIKRLLSHKEGEAFRQIVRSKVPQITA